MRVVRVVFALLVTASAIELVDQGGVAGEASTFAAVAQSLRDVRSGERVPSRFEELGDLMMAPARLVGPFDEVTRALD